MKINHTIQVDLAQPGLLPRLQATQDDSISRVLQLHLKENGRPWPVPKDATVLVHFRKSDRTGGVYDTLPDGSAAWQIRGCEILATLAPQVLTAAGDTTVGITLVKGSSRLTVATLLLHVIPCPGFAGISESYSYVSAFLPQPATASPGQLLQVKEVNEQGVVLSTEAVSGGISGSTGAALLSLLQKAVYTEDVSAALAVLAQQFEGTEPAVTLSRIEAVYTGSAVYTGTDAATLQNITVTAHYSDGTQQQVKNFSVSGVIGYGENTVTVHYGGCTDTVTVVGIARPAGSYSVYNNLTYATNSNAATTVSSGDGYSCIIRAVSGYELKRLVITMDGKTVLEENYTTAPLETGWSTDNVTGDIVITALAEQIVALSRISAVYSGGSVQEGTKLNALLPNLTVTAYYTDGTQKTLDGGYGVDGTIGVGTNIITVSYGGCTATFTVTGTKIPATYVLTHSWDLTQSLTDSVGGVTAETNATQDSNGVSFSAVNQYILLLPAEASILNKAVEIDIASGTPNAPATQHGRIFGVGSQRTLTNTDAACFTWRYNSTVGWANYAGNVSGGGWDISLDSTAYPLDFFNGKTVRLAFDDQGYITLSYAQIGSSEFTQIYTFGNNWDITTGYFTVGGALDNELLPITFSGVRIYEEV